MNPVIILAFCAATASPANSAPAWGVLRDITNSFVESIDTCLWIGDLFSPELRDNPRELDATMWAFVDLIGSNATDNLQNITVDDVRQQLNYALPRCQTILANVKDAQKMDHSRKKRGIGALSFVAFPLMERILNGSKDEPAAAPTIQENEQKVMVIVVQNGDFVLPEF